MHIELPRKKFLHTEKNIFARKMLTKIIRAVRKLPTHPPPDKFCNGPSLTQHLFACQSATCWHVTLSIA